MSYYGDLEELTEHLGDLLKEYRYAAELEDDRAEKGTASFCHHVATRDAYVHAAARLTQVLNRYAPGKEIFSVPGDWSRYRPPPAFL